MLRLILLSTTLLLVQAETGSSSSSSCPADNPQCLVQPEEAAGVVNATKATATQAQSQDNDFDTCSLYLAPSTIDNGGLGLFAGSDIPVGTAVGEDDLFVTITDKFKTLPYRGHQRFLSWLGYVYPEEPDFFWPMTRESFPLIHPSHYKVDEGLNAVSGLPFLNALGDKVSAFVPGVASMVNSHQEWANLDRDPTSHQTEYTSTTASTYTPNYGVSFHATRPITAGAELFLDYGDLWHTRQDTKHEEGFVAFEETAEEYMEGKDITIPTEEDKRFKRIAMEEKLHQSLVTKFHSEVMAEAKQKSSGDGNGKGLLTRRWNRNETHEEEVMVSTTTTQTTATDIQPESVAKVETEVKVTTTTTNTYPIPGMAPNNNNDNTDNEDQNLHHLIFPIGTTVMDDFEEGRFLVGHVTNYDDETEAYEVTFSNGHVDYYANHEEMVQIVEHIVDRKEAALKEQWEQRASERLEYQKQHELSKQQQEGNNASNSKRPLKWLQEHGVCIDNLKAGDSSIPDAGRGAFAKRAIRQGSVISPAPLLALKRDDLIIYQADESTTILRDVLHFDKPMGQELLLNYCYGKEGSELLLLPFAPVVNFINHNGKAPNAMIRWPSDSKTSSLFRDAQEWLELHPLDVLDQSGKLMMEFVALRDIQPDEEITIDYGRSWEEAWEAYQQSDDDDESTEFRQAMEAPDSFYPPKWYEKAEYKLASLDHPLQPGEIDELRWAHNGERVAEGLLRVGLPKGFSAKMKDYADARGITGLYDRLTTDTYLEEDAWHVIHPIAEEQWFAHRFMNTIWKFNMHYVAAWNEAARKSVYDNMLKEGFATALEGVGKYFGLNHTTCFHFSWMGLTEADNSFTHADVYATGKKAYNLIYPIVTVDGTKPELDIISDDANVEISVKYEYDVAYVLGDWGYHKTSANDNEGGQLRLVAGTYCGQIDETNAEMLAHIYDGEDPAPFMNQFKLPLQDYHWKASDFEAPVEA